MTIHLRNISKTFGDYAALSDVSLQIRTGELVALLGPSGSGKTTLLRIIAGLENADSGELSLEGEHAAGQPGLPARKIGFVFQHYALFRHMTVFENVAFGLRVRPKPERPAENQIRRKVLSLLKLVHLEGLHSRYPSQLSGGQRQRVALARALAVEPQVLLLDEPFGALDAKVRKELRRWMRRLHDEMPITSIFVTHDQEEAMEVADRVVVMNHGRIEQIGSPEEVWNKPANSFVYDFLGNYNAFDGWRDGQGNVRFHAGESVSGSQTAFVNETAEDSLLHRYPWLGGVVRAIMPRSTKTPLITLNKTPPKADNGNLMPVRLFARPHEMAVHRKPEGQNAILATLAHINPAGSLVKLEWERENGDMMQVELPVEEWRELALKKGEKAYISARKFRMFD